MPKAVYNKEVFMATLVVGTIMQVAANGQCHTENRFSGEIIQKEPLNN